MSKYVRVDWSTWVSIEDLRKKEEELRKKEDAFLKRSKWSEIINSLWELILKALPVIKDFLKKSGK